MHLTSCLHNCVFVMEQTARSCPFLPSIHACIFGKLTEFLSEARISSSCQVVSPYIAARNISTSVRSTILAICFPNSEEKSDPFLRASIEHLCRVYQSITHGFKSNENYFIPPHPLRATPRIEYLYFVQAKMPKVKNFMGQPASRNKVCTMAVHKELLKQFLMLFQMLMCIETWPAP